MKKYVNGIPFWANVDTVQRAAKRTANAAAKIKGGVETARRHLKDIEAGWRAAHPLSKSTAQKAVNRFSGRGIIRPEKAGHLVAAGHESMTAKDALPRVRVVAVWAADNAAAIVGAAYVAAARKGQVAVKVGSKWMTLAQYAHELGVLRADVNALTGPKSWAAAVKAAAKLAVWIDAPAIGEVRAAKAAILAAMK